MPEDADGVTVCPNCASSNLVEGTEYPFTEVKYICMSCRERWSEFDEAGFCKREECNEQLTEPWNEEKEGYCSETCQVEDKDGD